MELEHLRHSRRPERCCGGSVLNCSFHKPESKPAAPTRPPARFGSQFQSLTTAEGHCAGSSLSEPMTFRQGQIFLTNPTSDIGRGLASAWPSFSSRSGTRWRHKTDDWCHFKQDGGCSPDSSQIVQKDTSQFSPPFGADHALLHVDHAPRQFEWLWDDEV